MSNIPKIKEEWNNNVPLFRNKVSKLLDSGNSQKSTIVNPFLDKNGNLKNPYINYQKALDNPKISSKAKMFIQQATGLTPTPTVRPAVTQVQSNAVTEQNSTADSGASAPATTEKPNASATPVTPSDVGASNSSIVNAARNYIGTPYVWGGESMSEGGMDCSGFVYAALNDAGYKVGRTTAQGYRGQGTVVKKSEMKPGDLIFYGKDKSNASHIGIYIGNGQMIHSAGGSRNTRSNPGKGVSIVSVDHRSDFIEARRY